jgi:hypothetical protein
MSDSTPSLPPWTLLAVIGVDKKAEVQCQCKACGHRIFAAIHMIQLPDGEIKCWGSDCYAREAGLANLRHMKPLYPGVNGRRLTDEERAMLTHNRDQLLAQFKAEYEAKLRRQEEEAHRRQEEDQQVAEAARPVSEARKASADPVVSFLDGMVETSPAPSLSTMPPRHPSLPNFRPPPVDYTALGHG